MGQEEVVKNIGEIEIDPFKLLPSGVFMKANSEASDIYGGGGSAMNRLTSPFWEMDWFF